MTVIIGYHCNDEIHLGCDTEALFGTVRYPKCNDKIYGHGRWIIGMAGYLRHSSIVISNCEGIFDPPGEACDIATRIREAIEEDAGEIEAGDSVKGVDFEAMLVDCQNLKLYLIDGSFGVQEIVPGTYFAAGTGAPVAIGAMASMIAYCDTSDPRKMVKVAVEACIEHAQGCGGRAQVYSYC